LSEEPKVSRRKYLQIAGGTVVGLAVGGALGYLAKPSEVTTVTSTLTETVTVTGTAPPPTTLPPTPAKRLVRIGNAWPIYLDPAVGQDFASQRAQTNVYDPLVWPSPQGPVTPWVAESWTTSPDGLVYTFKIKNGIKFHSGRELTAEDVAFSMQRVLTIGQGYGFIFAPYVKEAKALDKYTVQFTLKKVFGPFVSALIRLYIVDKEEVMAHIKTPGAYGEFGDYATEWMLVHDAGSGPYKVKEIKLENYVHVEIFPDYWAGGFSPRAPTEAVFLPTAPSPATQKTMMLGKELEVSDQWQSEEWLSDMDAQPGISKKTQLCAAEYYHMLCCKKPPLDDVHVRKALAYCFDYQTAMKTIYSRFSESRSSLPMSLPGAIDCQLYSYDLTKAEEELKKSKYYPDIIDNPGKYVMEFHVMPEVPERERDALLLADQASRIGLKINLVKTPWLKYIEIMSKVETAPHIACMAISAYFPDAAFMLYTKYHSSSAGHVDQNEYLQDPKLDAMLEDALASLDETQRLAKCGEIQKYIMDVCPTLYIYDWNIVEAVQDYVHIPSFDDPTQTIKTEGYSVILRTWEVGTP